MAKETFYFSHDYNARTDVKIRALLRAHGVMGYGLYWAIVEDLYNNDNTFSSDYEVISYELRVGIDVVKSVINDFGLFTVNDGYFSSDSVKRRLEQRNQKSEIAKNKAKKRWEKAAASKNDATAQENDATAMQQHDASNAIKESKVKESKVKKNIETDVSPASPLVFKPDVKSEYQELTPKDTSTITKFIKANQPVFYEPYFDLWNCFAAKYNLPKVTTMSDKRKKKLGVRLKESAFDFVSILSKASKAETALTLGFLTFDWVVENTGNYLKLLEGNYDSRTSPHQHSVPAVNSQVEDILKLKQQRSQ